MNQFFLCIRIHFIFQIRLFTKYTKSGGKLLYSTCTIHRAENQENAAWFVEQYPEFELVRERQFLPGVDDSDGFYIAEFVRK